MSLRSSKTARNLQIAACVLGAVLTHRAEASPVMKVCVDQTNPTSTMDARVARAALKTQGYDFREIKFIGHGKLASDGFPISRFAKMANSECKLIMGFPVDISNPHLPPKVQSTEAYASTGFVLVEHGGAAPVSLAELPKGSEVGIAQLDTWAGLLFSTHPNIVMHVYPEDVAMLADLERHKITAGMTWQPFLQSYKARHHAGRKLRSRMLEGRHMVWNLVALYAPGSEAAADLFGKGLEALRKDGKLKTLIQPYEAAAAIKADKSAQSSPARSNRQAALNGFGGHLVKVSKKKKAAKPPAMFTADQAQKGTIAYYQNCAMCHGPQLNGQEGGFPGPALKGEDFADPSYDFSVSDIFNFVAKLMPAATPGSLTHEQDVQIMAFILQQNGYPAGSTELTYEDASKSKVPMLFYGKKVTAE